MNALVPASRISPGLMVRPGQQVSLPIDALGGGAGGPLPIPSPWQPIALGAIGYSYAAVLGGPAGGPKGPGTLNATGVFINGQPLSVTPTVTADGTSIIGTGVLSSPLTVAVIDAGTF